MMKNKQKGISVNKVTYMTHPRRGTPVVSDMLTNPKLTQGLVTTPTFVPESPLRHTDRFVAKQFVCQIMRAQISLTANISNN